MKTKLLTLALFGFMSLSFLACSEEEITPVDDLTIEAATAECECEGGLSDREGPGIGE